MAGKFRYQDRDVEIAENWRLDEQTEAENALGIDLDEAKSGAKMAFVLYVSIRRVNKDLPNGALADQVWRMQITDIVSEDDAGPPAVEPGAAEEPGGDSVTAAQPTTGRPRSGSLA